MKLRGGAALYLSPFALACGGLVAPADDAGWEPALDATAPHDASHDAAPEDSAPEAGDGGCPPNAPFNPMSLPGLVMFLDARWGVDTNAGGVQSWADQTQYHNNAEQMTPSLQPTVLDGALGTIPAVHFDGVSAMLVAADSPSLHWGKDDYALAVLARFSTAQGTTNQMLFHRATANAPWYGAELYVNSAKPSLAPRLSFQTSELAYATSSQSSLDGSFHVFSGRRLGTTLEVRVDGVLGATSTVSPIDDVSDVGQPLSIGHNYDPSPGFEALDGDIVTLVAVHGTVDDATMHALECGLLSATH